MNVLVVGSSGFIGKCLLLKIPKKWIIYGICRRKRAFQLFLERNKLANVTPLKCDLRNLKEIERALRKLDDIDVCLYLAANTKVGELVEDPILDVSTNIIPLVNFLKCFKGNKLVYFSSGAVYMGLSGKVSPSSKVNPTIPYAISKYACEQYVKFHRKMKRNFKQYVNLRFFGAYGPFESSRKISTKLLELIRHPTKNEFVVYGDGQNLIDFMYVDDAIDGILAVLKSSRANATVDFCSGNPMTINELVTEVGRIFGKEIEIVHKGSSPEYISFYASPERMLEMFDFKPSVSLEDGFQRFSTWLERTSSRLNE